MMGEKGSVASLWRIGYNDQQNMWNWDANSQASETVRKTFRVN